MDVPGINNSLLRINVIYKVQKCHDVMRNSTLSITILEYITAFYCKYTGIDKINWHNLKRILRNYPIEIEDLLNLNYI